MLNNMPLRAITLTICFLLTSVYIAGASKTESVRPRQPLSGFPILIDNWRGQDLGDFTTRVVTMLGVNDYINRTYVDRDKLASLYIGFYQSQREGSAIHSPMNCLPGAGWNPADRLRLTIPVTSSSESQTTRNIEVNRIIIEKGTEKQMVLYWYHSHGRVIPSEYWGKVYTVLDAIRLNRTDAALVRVITPMSTQNAETAATAQETAVQFVQAMFPLLSATLPD
jgi:EpsI family protein